MKFEEIAIDNAYRLLAPRPTIIVTTINSHGQVNAAPFSFTMPVSMKPPLIAFASVPTHHTFQNLQESHEFVVNIPTEHILEKLWITGEKLPQGVNELEKADLTQLPSAHVRPPRISECVAHLECKVHWIKQTGDHHIVVGEVLAVHAHIAALKDGLLDVEAVKPILHLGGVNFVVGDHLKKVE